MTKRTDRLKEINNIDACNAEFCESLTSSYNLEDFFPNEPYLVSIFKNYRSRKLNELTLFWCFFITFMHWSSDSKLFDRDTYDYIVVKLYGVLRGDSVSHKSGYIRPIRQAFDFIEKYFKERFTDSHQNFNSSCIESLTAAKLIIELQTGSKFLSSDEDRPLTDFAFFEPNTTKAKEIHPSLITAFNGAYKIKRSTMTYSTEVRGGHGLTILVPTTGDQWPFLLEHFVDGSKTNGLYERFLYWTIGKKNFIQENTVLNHELPSIEYLYGTRMLIGKRVYEYDNETINYLRPILSSMRNNNTAGSDLYTVPSNIRAEAGERRGADLVERIAVVFQNIFDTLQVLESIKSIHFETIKKTTLDEIKDNIKSVFYSNDGLSQVNNEPTYGTDIDLKNLSEVQITSVKVAPLHSMKIGLSAAKAAVKFFHKLLLPQSIQLFSTDSIDDKKMIINELKIIKYPINCFSISDLTANSIFHNHKRDNIDVKKILFNLENKNLLKRGKYIKAGNRTIDAWLKILPEFTNDEQIKSFQNELKESYDFTLEKYIDYFEKGSDDKTSLNEATERLLLEQRSSIEKLREKLLSDIVEQNNSEPPSPLPMQISQVQDIFQDVIDMVTTIDSTNDLQTTCLKTIESNQTIEQIDISSTNKYHEDISMKNHEVLLDDYQYNDDIIRDCLSHLLEQVIELIDVTNKTIVDRGIDQNEITSSSIEISRKTTTSIDDKYIPDNIKVLCNKLLLSNTIVLSRTKLNKVCKINVKDTEKACKVLMDYELFSLETNFLGNKHCYYESFLKQIPKNQSELVSFTMKLSMFGIDNINNYYATLKTIDTQNATYLTPYGQSILQKSYNNHNVEFNEGAIIQPAKNCCRRFFNLSNDRHSLNEENSTMMETGESTDVEHSSSSSNTASKRRRELTGKGKQYQERNQSKKNKKDDH